MNEKKGLFLFSCCLSNTENSRNVWRMKERAALLLAALFFVSPVISTLLKREKKKEKTNIDSVSISV